MTITGSGGDYNQGGPMPPPPDVLDTHESRQMLRYGTQLTPDSLMNSLTMQQAISTKEDNRSGHYQSPPSRPTISMLVPLRVGLAPEPEVDDSWQLKYENLVKGLPENIQQRLEEGGTYFITGLDHLIEKAAQFEVWVENAGRPAPEGSTAARREELYRLLPYLVLQGGDKVGGELLSTLKETMSDLGANFPQYATMADTTSDFGELFNKYSALANKVLSGQATAEDLTTVRKMAEDISSKADLYATRNNSDATALLQPQLAAMAIVMRSLQSPIDVNPALLLGVGIGSIGLQGGKDGSGFIGNNVGTLLDSFSKDTLGSLVASNEAAKEVVKELATIYLVGVLTLSSLVSKYGVGPSTEEGKGLEASRHYDVQLFLLAALSSGIPELFADMLATAGQVPEKDRPQFTAALLLGTVLTAVLASNKDVDQQTHLLQSLNAFIKEPLTHLADAQQQAALEGERGSEGVYLQQGKAALDAGDVAGIMESFYGGLPSLGTTDDGLGKDIKDLRHTTDNIADLVQNGLENKQSQINTISNAV